MWEYIYVRLIMDLKKQFFVFWNKKKNIGMYMWEYIYVRLIMDLKKLYSSSRNVELAL